MTPDPDNSLEDGAYAASDDDDEAITYSVVEPDDEDFFSITPGAGAGAGVLTINASHPLNFEDRDSYSITIEATSGDG